MMKKNFLLNPFERIAGWQALGWGLAAIVVAAALGSVSGLFFDGAIDAHFAYDPDRLIGVPVPLLRAVAMHLIDWAVIAIVMLLAATIFYRGKFRAIDIAGTMALARTPLVGLVLLMLVPIFMEHAAGTLLRRNLIFLMISGVAFLFFTVWMIVWMWKGFKVSCNARGAKGGWIFAIALIVSEIAINQLYVAIGWLPSIAEILKKLSI